MLQPFADDVWIANSEQRLAGVVFPSRMTVVRLPGGKLWLHSPIVFSRELLAEVEELGEVAYVVAPSTYHHMHIGDWMQACPQAEFLGARGLAKKRKDLHFGAYLGDAAEPWGEGLAGLEIAGMPGMQEWVFFHPVSKTLIVTDFLFNIHQCQGLFSQLVFRMTGAWKRLAQSRLWRSLVKDKEAARQSTLRLLEWDFERVILAHGEPLRSEAKPQVREAVAWLVGDAVGAEAAPAVSA